VPLATGLELLFLEGIDFDGRLRVRGDRLVGSNSLFAPFEQELPPGTDPASIGIQKTRVVTLRAPDGTFHSLDPWVVKASCPTCKHTRVLVADAPKEGKAQYIDVMVGHRVCL